MINLLNNDAFANIGHIDKLVDAAEIIVSHLIPDARLDVHYCEPQFSDESSTRAIARYVVTDAVDNATIIDAVAGEAGVNGDDAYEAICTGQPFAHVTDNDELWNELALNVAGRIAAIAAGADAWQLTPDACPSCGYFLDWS